LKLTVEDFTTSTGWVASDATKVSVKALNELPDYIAGYNTKSLVFEFKNDALNEYIEKDLSVSPFDVTNYNELVFHVWSREHQNTGVGLVKASDFKYKLDIYSSEGFLIGLSDHFQDITFDISEINTINKIRITALSNTGDFILFSEMLAVKDELPLDIFQGTKEAIENVIDNNYATQYPIGTVTASAGDTDIDITGNRNWIDKYAVITITDGVNSETHQIAENTEINFKFNSMYNGNSMLKNYTAANVYLKIPVGFGRSAKEIFLPGIAIWGMTPEPILRGSKLDKIYDTYKSDFSATERRDAQIQNHTILVDCEARETQTEILADMSQLVRNFIAKEGLWINGKKFYIKHLGSPTFLEGLTKYNQINKIQWEFSVEVKEEIYSRTTIPAITTQNLTMEASV